MFVYNDAMGHVTRFWPPDWLLLHTSSIPRHRGDSQFTQFPTSQLDGGGSLVSTFSSFYPVTRVWYLSPLCQLIHKGSKSWLDSHFADLMGHSMERISDQVKLSFGDSWFSHVDRLICSVTFQCEVRAFNLTFHLL